jgi:pimeloyl-ACP methyl ester carboxylesterase
MGITRRDALGSLPTALAYFGLAGRAPRGSDATPNRRVEYGQSTLPAGIRSRYVDNNNGLRMHLLEAGFETTGRRCLVLLHGFPELAYTWRHQLLPLAAMGFHVVAPDLRGYGRTATAPVSFDDDLRPYLMFNRVTDVLGLARALGHDKVASVVGHDWGSPTAAWCALVRPDVFQSVVLMSTPFAGPPALPLDTANGAEASVQPFDIEKELAALPRPRKHYWWYYSTREANADLRHAPQGVHDLLRAYFYYKSADWKGNQPFALKARTATELAKLPTYYVMDLNQTIAQTVTAKMPSASEIAACRWMTESDLDVYGSEYVRTGFQGGLNAYRVLTSPVDYDELSGFSGRTIDVPSCFIGGAHDWGVRQSPGALEAMQNGACTRLLGVHFADKAGHSIPEEQPEQVSKILVDFLQQPEVRGV